MASGVPQYPYWHVLSDWPDGKRFQIKMMTYQTGGIWSGCQRRRLDGKVWGKALPTGNGCVIVSRSLTAG